MRFRAFFEDIENTVPPATDDASMPVRISYAVYNVFQRYWEGQGDPLYAILSRRGDSVDSVTVYGTSEEVDRLKEVSQEILRNNEDPGEVATATALLKTLGWTESPSE